MPQSVLSRARVLGMLPSAPSPDELEEMLFRSKAEFKGGTGDEFPVEVTADRLDLLSEGGLGLYLQGATGASIGRLKPAAMPPLIPPPEIRVAPAVEPIRPYISAVIVHAPSAAGLDPGLLAEAVRYQELLHATVGLDRRLASFGLYPCTRILPPFTYSAEPAAGIGFVPLDGERPISGADFLATHPMAQRYGRLGVREGYMLTLRDGAGSVMSLPPILNARPAGEVRVGDPTILIESTGTRAARVTEGLALLSLVFVARGWSISPVAIRYADRTEEGRAIVDPRPLELPTETLRRLSGHAYTMADVERLLRTARLDVRATPTGWTVEVPPWRPDILSDVDLAEEVILMDGVRAEEGIVPPSRNLGRRRAESLFRHRLGTLLLGAGFTELYTPVLIGEAATQRFGRTGTIALANPVSAEFARLRDSLLPGLVAALEHNVRYGYPQRFFEVGPVLERDASADTGAATRYHAGAILAGETAGFADAAGLADYLVGGAGGGGIREPVEIPGTIPGRAARLRVAGEPVADIAEVAPEVLAEVRVPVPVAWLEIDLTRLWPLVRRSPTN